MNRRHNRMRRLPPRPQDAEEVTPATTLEPPVAEALVPSAETTQLTSLGPRAPAAVIEVGELAEDPDAYLEHRSVLARSFGVATDAEELLLDRVATLSWRLARIPQVERAQIALASGRRERVESSGYGTSPQIVYEFNGALNSGSVTFLQRVRGEIVDLCNRLADALDVPESTIRSSLARAYGFGAGTTVLGGGEAIATRAVRWVALHHERVPGVRPEDTQDLLDELEPQLFGALGQTLQAIDEQLTGIDTRICLRRRLSAESRGMPSRDDLHSLIASEQHLSRELREATRELERAIARRALRRLLQGIGPGR